MKTLIIVDMQNDFLTGSLGNEHCKGTISKVTDLIKNEKWDYAFLTKDTHGNNYIKTLEGKKLPIPHCIHGTDGWEIEKSIIDAILEKDLGFDEIQKPTFGSTGLRKAIVDEYEWMYGQQAAEMLGRGADLEFHVCGVCTSICVLANVVLLRACWPDAKIVVHADACGDVTKEMHEAAKICFAAQQCEVVGE